MTSYMRLNKPALFLPQGIQLASIFFISTARSNKIFVFNMLFLFFVGLFQFPDRLKDYLAKLSMHICSRASEGLFIFNILGGCKISTMKKKRGKARIWINFFTENDLLVAYPGEYDFRTFWLLTIVETLQQNCVDNRTIFIFYAERLKNVLRKTADEDVDFLIAIRHQMIDQLGVKVLPFSRPHGKSSLCRLFPRETSEGSDPFPLFLLLDFIQFIWAHSRQHSRFFAVLLMLQTLMCSRAGEFCKLKAEDVFIKPIAVPINHKMVEKDCLSVLYRNYKTANGRDRLFEYLNLPSTSYSIVLHFKLLGTMR